MPTYDYLCDKHGEFEETHSIKTKLEFCPKCAEEGVTDHPVTRLISLNGKGVVELSGKELIAKLQADGADLQRKAQSNEKLYANLLGEDKYQSMQSAMDKRKRR